MAKARGQFWRALTPVAGALVLSAATSSAATFIVSNTNDSGPGSLRQAILDANLAPGADTIAFHIPGAGVHTIGPLSALPPLTDNAGVTIDGYTQPGSKPNRSQVGDNAVLLIALDGAALGAGESGLALRSSSNLVRGLVIHGFGFGDLGEGAGISVENGSGNVVSGCFLGTDPTGSLARPNEFGVVIAQGHAMPLPLPSNTTVGGSSPAERNVISGNASIGTLIGFVVATRVIGNYIGTNASGKSALGNGGSGIVAFSSRQLLIGGTDRGSGNLVSGNTGLGIVLQDVDGAVQGNLIGTDAAGSAAVPNDTGIYVVIGAAGTLIGGTAPRSTNVISGNASHGVRIFRPLGTTVTGNLIGTDLAGKVPLGNHEDGVLIRNPESVDTVGAGVIANVIAFNGAAGVAVGPDPEDPSHANRVSGNSIHDNGGLGIDLGSDGVTGNISCGAGQGPNLLQNFPVLTSAVRSGRGTRIQGTLNAAPSSAFLLEFYSSSSCDPTGYGEGERFLGTAQVTTDATCNGNFDVTLPVAAPAGSFITATATDGAGNTSEFSACQLLGRHDRP